MLSQSAACTKVVSLGQMRCSALATKQVVEMLPPPTAGFNLLGPEKWPKASTIPVRVPCRLKDEMHHATHLDRSKAEKMTLGPVTEVVGGPITRRELGSLKFAIDGVIARDRQMSTFFPIFHLDDRYSAYSEPLDIRK